MTTRDKESAVYGKHAEIISKSGDCTVYRITENDGDIIMSSYRVFDGINLVYNDIHTQSFTVEKGEAGHILEINHCVEGRIDCSLKNKYFFLEPGDISIIYREDSGHDSFFPTKHYHGITISIDMDHAPDCLSAFQDDVKVQPAELIEKFCSDGACFAARSADYTEHIFSELYSVRDCIRPEYLKIKVFELLLFLSREDSNSRDIGKRCFAPSHVDLVKRTCKYIASHQSERITIERLSSLFHVSTTQLKNCFRRVYGVPVYTYIRSQKMLAASHYLKTTDYKILDIGNRFGYDNGSKFAKAFRDVMGMTPNEYRNFTQKTKDKMK